MNAAKLTLPIGLALALGSAAVGAAGSYAANKSQVAELVTTVRQSADRIDILREMRSADREEQAETRTQIKQITRALERIEDRLGTRR